MPTCLNLKVYKSKLRKKGLKCVKSEFQYFQLKKDESRRGFVSVSCQTSNNEYILIILKSTFINLYHHPVQTNSCLSRSQNRISINQNNYILFCFSILKAFAKVSSFTAESKALSFN